MRPAGEPVKEVCDARVLPVLPIEGPEDGREDHQRVHVLALHRVRRKSLRVDSRLRGVLLSRPEFLAIDVALLASPTPPGITSHADAVMLELRRRLDRPLLRRMRAARRPAAAHRPRAALATPTASSSAGTASWRARSCCSCARPASSRAPSSTAAARPTSRPSACILPAACCISCVSAARAESRLRPHVRRRCWRQHQPDASVARRTPPLPLAHDARAADVSTRRSASSPRTPLPNQPAFVRPLVRAMVTDPEGMRRRAADAMPRVLFVMIPALAAILALFYRGRHFPEHLYFAVLFQCVRLPGVDGCRA